MKKKKATKQAIITVMGQIVRSEVASICSDDFDSVTRSKSINLVKNFKHATDSINSELRSRAPTFHSLLMSCLKTTKPR